MAFPLPGKPSIAVLPFVNMSGDSRQEYFVDGITNNIISALFEFKNLFVIASSSTYTYKSKPAKVQEVSEELGKTLRLHGLGSCKRLAEQLERESQEIDGTRLGNSSEGL